MSSNQNHIERELKIDLVSGKNFEKFLSFLGWKGIPSEQRNLFFDTPDFILKSRKFALRIREENNICTLTAKGPKLDDSELTARSEIECGITPADVKGVLENKINLFNLDYEPIYWLEKMTGLDLGSYKAEKVLDFQNKRHQVHIDCCGKKVLLEIDLTDYGNNNLSYELEVEFKSVEEFGENRNYLKNLLERAEIPWKLSGMSKYAKGLKYKTC